MKRNSNIPFPNRFLLVIAGCCLLLQTFSKVIIYLDFELNRDYITKNLCVNKDNPESTCKGSCHLNSALQEDENTDENPSNTPQKQRTNQEITLFSATHFPFKLVRFIPSYEMMALLKNHFSQQHLFAVFHPPQG